MNRAAARRHEVPFGVETTAYPDFAAPSRRIGGGTVLR
jgi:hypothetical protein